MFYAVIQSGSKEVVAARGCNSKDELREKIKKNLPTLREVFPKDKTKILIREIKEEG